MQFAEAQAQHARLLADVREHKTAVGYHRRRLIAAREALAHFEQTCRTLGLKLILVSGEGSASHGRTDETPT